MENNMGTTSVENPPVKQRKTSRCRRGLANKKSKSASSENSNLSKKSTIYSTRVSKCFSDFSNTRAEVIPSNLNDSDVEDDCQIIDGVMSGPTCHLEIDSDENESRKSVRPDDATSLDRSASPSPPPSPHEVKYNLRPGSGAKLKRGFKKALMNLDGLGNILNTSPGMNTSLVEGDVLITHIEKEEMTVRVQYLDKLYRYSLSKDDTFSVIILRLADDLMVEEDQVMLVLGERTITPADTPMTLKLTVADIIACHIDTTAAPSRSDSSIGLEDSNMIKVFIQSKNSRQRTEMTVNKTWPLKILMHQYARLKKIPVSSLRFLFDGEDVHGKETAESLEMENGDCMDVLEVVCLDIS